MQKQRRNLRNHDTFWPLHPHHRHRRRPTSRSLWTKLPDPRPREKYLWHRVFYADEPGPRAPHLARAALESIAFQVSDLLEVMRADIAADAAIKQLRVDGGASRNNLLLQFQADLLRVPVVRPKVTETTALGAAMLAGLGVGL